MRVSRTQPSCFGLPIRLVTQHLPGCHLRSVEMRYVNETVVVCRSTYESRLSVRRVPMFCRRSAAYPLQVREYNHQPYAQASYAIFPSALLGCHELSAVRLCPDA